MANTGYGQERYGRSLYGALTYHELEAELQASASTSVVPTLSFNVTDEQINVISGGTVSANSIFQNQTSTIDAQSSSSSTGVRVFAKDVQAIIQNSNHLIHGFIVGQPSTFILSEPTITPVATQVDVIPDVDLNNAVTTNVVGTQIDLGASTLSASSSVSSVGTQIDLTEVNPIVDTSTTAVAIQIDLGVVTSCNARSVISTLNPIFSSIDFLVKENIENTLSVDNLNTYPHDVPTRNNINYQISDSSLSGDTIGLSNVPNGRFNTSSTHVSYKTDSNGNTYLQVSGGLDVTTGGGATSPSLKTVYKFTNDTSATPSYTGSAWPYIYVRNLVSQDIGINVTVGYEIVSGYNILLIDGRPVYQFTGDSDDTTANGSALTQWEAITKDGGIQNATKSTTTDDSLILTGTGASKTGTEGNAGAKISLNTTNEQYYFLFKYNGSTSNSLTFNTTLEAGSIESVSLLIGDSIFSATSTLSIDAIRNYFLTSGITSTSSISIDGGLKWINQTVPDEVWTEQTIARENS